MPHQHLHLVVLLEVVMVNIKKNLVPLNIKIPERVLQESVLTYLNNINIFSWENRSVGVFDEKKSSYRASKSKFNLRGTSDILGVINGTGTILAIEMKTSEELTYITKHWNSLRDKYQATKKKAHYQRQILFVENVRKAGGIAFFSDSVGTTRKKLIEYGVIDGQKI